MGIGFVLIIYGIVLLIAASGGAFVLGLLASILIKRGVARRKVVILTSASFPFVCVLFAGMWFATYATINYLVFHRDPGLGDSRETPLPNGYALMMIDTTDQGTIYDPKTQPGGGLVVGQKDAMFGVRQLQVSKTLIFGASDSGYFGRMGQDSRFVDTYFELDSAQHSIVRFKTFEELRKRAAAEGIALQLREFQSVFGDYRTTWFDYFAGSILVSLPISCFVWLIRWVLSVRRIEKTLPIA